MDPTKIVNDAAESGNPALLVMAGIFMCAWVFEKAWNIYSSKKDKKQPQLNSEIVKYLLNGFKETIDGFKGSFKENTKVLEKLVQTVIDIKENQRQMERDLQEISDGKKARN